MREADGQSKRVRFVLLGLRGLGMHFWGESSGAFCGLPSPWDCTTQRGGQVRRSPAVCSPAGHRLLKAHREQARVGTQLPGE